MNNRISQIVNCQCSTCVEDRRRLDDSRQSFFDEIENAPVALGQGESLRGYTPTVKRWDGWEVVYAVLCAAILFAAGCFFGKGM